MADSSHGAKQGAPSGRLPDSIPSYSTPQFRDPGAPFVGICRFSTRTKCLASQSASAAASCSAAHFIVRQLPQTEASLGECSYLNTCHHLDTCRYVHYELETPSPAQADDMAARRAAQAASRAPRDRMLPPQWLDADLRKLDATVLGKFDVIMADPPWDSEWPERLAGYGVACKAD